ncbi:MAG: hypothetical protein IT320_26065 [Anaerolineae bacterium]|nr:hypothetical protein [Anaerolineae bacterium]
MALNLPPENSDPTIDNLRRKLAEIRAHDGDVNWFGAHESSIRNTVWKAIAKPPVYREAIETLFICLKNLRSHKAFQWWQPVVSDALLDAADLKDEKLQARLWLAYGIFMLHENQPGMAARSAEIGSAWLSDTDSEEVTMQRVQALLLMICASQPARSNSIVIQWIAKVLKSVRRSQDLAWKARTYQMIAHVYTYQGKYKPAVALTEAALKLWEQLGDVHGRIDCLINLSRIARNLRDFGKVEDLLNQIQIDPDSPTGHTHLMHRMYEEAAYLLESGQFAKAREMLELTIEYLQSMKLWRELAIVKHTLALTLIAQHHFDQAEETLAAVDESWQRLKYHYGQAEVCTARSYLERERGHKMQAREWLERARAICRDIENEPLRQRMLAMIDGESSKLGD